MSIPGVVPEKVVPEPPDLPELPASPTGAGKTKEKGEGDVGGGKEVKAYGTILWPPLKGDAIQRLQDQELPGDTFVSLRFKAKKNRGSLWFFPCVFLAFLSDSAVLVHETSAVPDGKGGKTCLYGTPAEDIFTDRKYCPAVGGLSSIWWSMAWYGLFLATCALAYSSGRVIRSNRSSQMPDAEQKLSPICYFLDCARAGYKDRHLAAWFVVVTLAFAHSVCARIVATPDEEDNIDNACLRYGHWTSRQDYCQPGGLLEPSWTVILLGTYFCFAAALMDQGTIFVHDVEDVGEKEHLSRQGCLYRLTMTPKKELTPDEKKRREEQRYPTENKRVTHVTGAAVKLKALIRKQMHIAHHTEMARNSSLAEFMMGPLYAMAWVWGLENDGDAGSDLDLDVDFETNLLDIFSPMMFQQDLAKIPKHKPTDSTWAKDLELCGPDALMRAQAQVMLRTNGCPAHDEWKAFVGHFDVGKDAVDRWKRRICEVDILHEYRFCPVLRSFNKHGFSRSMTEIVDLRDNSPASNKVDKDKNPEKRGKCSACGQGQICGGCRGHVVLGLLLGLLGFYIFSFWAPQGDSYAWVYYPVNTATFVEERCKDTNATADPSPWCDAPRYLLMSRTTLWVSHSNMLSVKRNNFGVMICAVLKAVICGMLGSIFSITVAKTVSGLRQASHPMVILDGILAWWARTEQMTTCHLHVWKLARDSILHNDVKNILDRYENVVLAYLAVSVWLITDSAIQIAIFSNAPNVMAGYVLLLFGGSTFLCVYQALLVHYSQIQHVATLKRLKESTYFSGAEPDQAHQRNIIDQMVARMSGGGDYQTKMLYMPLNPLFQKTLLGYFVTASIAVAVRLISESFQRKTIVDWGVLAPANSSSTELKWMAGDQQISMTVGG